jgi:hypothetical protein
VPRRPSAANLEERQANKIAEFRQIVVSWILAWGYRWNLGLIENDPPLED